MTDKSSGLGPDESSPSTPEGAATDRSEVGAAVAPGHAKPPRHRSPWALRFGRDTLARHPGVRAGGELTRGERAADAVRNGMGSWAFVTIFSVFLAVWMAYNGKHGFDPYPFILLNLVLSCVAAMQGAILLIAAKRSDQVAAELAVRDFETDTKASARIDELCASNAAIAAQLTAIQTVLAAAPTVPPASNA